jgi:outer membrane protein TolC
MLTHHLYNTFSIICIITLFTSCSQNPTNRVSNNAQSIVINNSKKTPRLTHYYTVKQGDTLYSIGLRFNYDYKQLAIWNHIDPPYKLTIDQQLKLINNPASKNKPTVRNSLNTNLSGRQINDAALENSQSSNTLQQLELVSDVLAANPRVQVARAVWEASIAQIAQTSALPDPKLSYGIAPLTIGSDTTSFVQNVQVSQQLPWFGKLDSQSNSARFEAVRNKELLNTLSLELTAITKKLFGDWYLIHQAIHIHHNNLRLLKQINAIAKTRYHVGKSNQQEVLQSELELSLIDQHRLQLNQQQSEILGHLNTLLNRPVDSPLPPSEALKAPLSSQEINQLQITALEQHPQIKAITASINSLQAKKQHAWLAGFPDFDLKAGYNTIMDNDDKHFTVGVAINLPLNQSKYHAIKDQASALLKKAQWEKQDKVHQLGEKIQLYGSKVKQQQQTVMLYDNKLLPLAKNNTQAALADYQSGQGDFMVLIRAEKDWHSAQLKAKQALTSYHQALAMLEYVIGVKDTSFDSDGY